MGLNDQCVGTKPVDTLRNKAAEIIGLTNECIVISDELEAKLLIPIPQETGENVKETNQDSLEGALDWAYSRVRRLHRTLMDINRKS